MTYTRRRLADCDRICRILATAGHGMTSMDIYRAGLGAWARPTRLRTVKGYLAYLAGQRRAWQGAGWLWWPSYDAEVAAYMADHSQRRPEVCGTVGTEIAVDLIALIGRRPGMTRAEICAAVEELTPTEVFLALALAIHGRQIREYAWRYYPFSAAA